MMTRVSRGCLSQYDLVSHCPKHSPFSYCKLWPLSCLFFVSRFHYLRVYNLEFSFWHSLDTIRTSVVFCQFWPAPPYIFSVNEEWGHSSVFCDHVHHRCDRLAGGAERTERLGLQSWYIPVLWVPTLNSAWLVSSRLVQHNFEWMFRLNILRRDKRESSLWGLRYSFQLRLSKRKFEIEWTGARNVPIHCTHCRILLFVAWLLNWKHTDCREILLVIY